MPDEGPGPVAVGSSAFLTDLPGVPVTVEVLAEALARRVLRAVDEGARVAAAARADVAIEWRGHFAERSHAVLDELAAHTEQALADLAEIVRRLRAYADRLRAAQRGLAELRRDARRAGLLVDDRMVGAPPGRECDLVPYLHRATALYESVALSAGELERSRSDLPGLGWLMQVPGAVATVQQGHWTNQASALRRGAAGLGAGSPGGVMDPAHEARAERLGARADDLVRRGTWLSRGTTTVMAPLGVVVDHADGESWEQAATSQGAGLVAGSLASAATAAGLSSWSGPGAIGVGLVAFGAGIVAGGVANAQVDARYEEARRRRTPAGLAERCGRAGSRRGSESERRRRDVADTRYGLR